MIYQMSVIIKAFFLLVCLAKGEEDKIERKSRKPKSTKFKFAVASRVAKFSNTTTTTATTGFNISEW